MRNTTEFKNFIRQPFAFAGGYQLHAVMKDGGCLCHKCAKDNAKLILSNTRNETQKDWACYDIRVNWEDADLFCDNCGEQLKPEYEMGE